MATNFSHKGRIEKDSTLLAMCSKLSRLSQTLQTPSYCHISCPERMFYDKKIRKNG